MKHINTILWTLLVVVWGAYFGFVFHVQEEHIELTYTNEDLVIGALAGEIVFIGGGVAAYFIAKKNEAKNPYKIGLITSSILVGIIAIQTFIF